MLKDESGMMSKDSHYALNTALKAVVNSKLAENELGCPDYVYIKRIFWTEGWIDLQTGDRHTDERKGGRNKTNTQDIYKEWV